LGALDNYWEESIQEVALSEEVLRDARQLAQRFPLRTYDAIHLASARAAKRMLRGLVKAARSLGLAIAG